MVTVVVTWEVDDAVVVLLTVVVATGPPLVRVLAGGAGATAFVPALPVLINVDPLAAAFLAFLFQDCREIQKHFKSID